MCIYFLGKRNASESHNEAAALFKSIKPDDEEIRKNPQITRKELSAAIGLTEEGIKYHLSKMQNKGQIRRIGPDKGGHWEIVKE